MKILSIIRKDLRTILSDKKALAIFLVMPLILMSILGFALKGVFVNDWEQSRIEISIVKQYDIQEANQRFHYALNKGILSQGIGADGVSDLTKASEKINPDTILFHDFLDSETVSDMLHYRVESEAAARDRMRRGEISAILYLPEHYYYDMKVNLLTPFRNKTEIEIVTNPNDMIGSQVALAVMKSYTDTVSSMIIGKNVLIETSMAYDAGNRDYAGMGTVMDGIMKSLESIRVELDDRTLEGRTPVTSTNYYAAAMLTMFILFAASHGGRMLLEEKDHVTWNRMMVAGTPKLGIMTGKFLSVFLIAFLQMVVMILFSRFALRVNWGEGIPVILISFAAAFAVAGVGTTVAAVTFRAGNYNMANIFQTLIIQSMALLGGSFFPIDIMPEIFQKLSILSLNGIALKAYLKIMMGYGFESTAGYVAALLCIGAAFAGLAVFIMRERRGYVDGKHIKTPAVKA